MRPYLWIVRVIAVSLWPICSFFREKKETIFKKITQNRAKPYEQISVFKLFFTT